MIVDNLSNISKYSELPQDVIDFIAKMNSEIPCGRYELVGENFINVEKYNTKPLSQAKYERHEKYIDIQILLKGKEYISIFPADNLSILKPYDKSRDIMFYSDDVSGGEKILLDGSNFVIIYPNEAHAPQISYDDSSQEVLKVVVKVKV